jgi:Domain of unknown function (DUF4157)
MFAPPVVKPKAKAASNNRLVLRRAEPLGQGHADAEPAQMLRRLPQGGVSVAHFANARPPKLAWNFSNVPASSPARELLFQMPPVFRAPSLPIQAKLKVGAVNDPLEQEADRVADQVIRMPAHEVAAASARPQISRKCDKCEEEEKLQKKEAGPQVATGEAPTSVHPVLRAPGQPLDAATRAYFEPRFGRDLTQVRVHADAPAAESARDVNAYAYTVGRNMVFDAGRFAPSTSEGRTLLAHELTHVVQQGFGRERGTLQRDTPKGEAPKQDAPKQDAPKQDPMEAAVKKIENRWKGAVAVATPFSELSPWINDGNSVVALIRTHTNAAQEAIRAHDEAAIHAYTVFLRSDMLMYDFIAWRVIVYANLLSLRDGVDSLVNAFDHDSDVGFGFHYFRKFKGRDQADRIARGLKKAIDGVPADSKSMLAMVRTDVQVPDAPVSKVGGAAVVTSAANPKVQATFTDLIAAMRNFQIKLQGEVEFENQFLDGAFDEAVDQTVDNLEEYYKIKNLLNKGDPKKKEEKKEETKPDIQPIPTRPIEEEESKLPAAMRFQVQWNSRAKDPTKKGQFSETATAPASVGVTTEQAVTALTATHVKVKPDRAKKAASPAVALQIKWIMKRPPAGIAIGGYSRSENFDYDYPDARVDVENLRGHNLRK